MAVPLEEQWSLFKRWAKKYRHACMASVRTYKSSNSDSSDAFFASWEDVCELEECGPPNLPTNIEELIEEKIDFMRRYLINVSIDGADSLRLASSILKHQSPGRYRSGLKLWFVQEDSDGRSCTGFCGMAMALYVNDVDDLDLVSVRCTSLFDSIFVHQSEGVAWTEAEAGALLSQVRENMQKKGGQFLVSCGGVGEVLLTIQVEKVLEESIDDLSDCDIRESAMERHDDEFSRYSILPGALCWQIDNDNLEPPLEDGEWEGELARALIDLAEAYGSSELLFATSAGPSVDFGHAGFSVWISCTGSPPLVKECGDLIDEVFPKEFIRRERTAASQSWSERIRIADGKVWMPMDAATWFEVGAGVETVDDSNDSDDFDESIESLVEWVGDDETCDHDDSEADDGELESIREVRKVRPKKTRINAARGDVVSGYYQRRIENMFGLPEGSVKFVNPDGTISKSNQLIRNLRARWEDK